MKDFLKQMLSSKGSVSSVRIMSLACAFTACGIAVYGAMVRPSLDGISELCAVLLSGAFTGKVAQKFLETKNEAVKDAEPN